MESIYIVFFIFFAVPAAFLEWSDNACFGLLSSSRGQQHKQQYLRFRNNYVVVFSLMMGKCSEVVLVSKLRIPVDRLFPGKPVPFRGELPMARTTGPSNPQQERAVLGVDATLCGTCPQQACRSAST
jgi:hypothetical protein